MGPVTDVEADHEWAAPSQDSTELTEDAGHGVVGHMDH